jgi:hypothetical protein
MQQQIAQPHGPSKSTLKLAFASIGVVFGDIGTSPLYAMREALHPVVVAGGDLRAAVIGVASLLIWALILIVTLKYVVFLMRADNKGEGGILSLVVLVESLLRKKGGFVLALGMIGAAFFFGDAMITPAMSVLSAVEGLKVVHEGFAPYIVPLTLAILVTLFLFQYKGTAGVASLFAPITFVWFFVLAVMGVVHIFDDLEICSPSIPPMACRCWWSGRGWRSSSSAACSLPSPAARRFTPTWGISARSPCAWRGWRWCSPGSSSIIWARAPSSSRTPNRSRTRSSSWSRAGWSCRSSSLPPPSPSSPRRRSSPAPSRLPSRPCRWACSRA